MENILVENLKENLENERAGGLTGVGVKGASRTVSGSRQRAVPPVRHIAPPLEIIRGLREIAAFLQISHSEVLELENSGAPIVRRKNILRAEKRELWEWFRLNARFFD